MSKFLLLLALGVVTLGKLFLLERRIILSQRELEGRLDAKIESLRGEIAAAAARAAEGVEQAVAGLKAKLAEANAKIVGLEGDRVDLSDEEAAIDEAIARVRGIGVSVQPSAEEDESPSPESPAEQPPTDEQP